MILYEVVHSKIKFKSKKSILVFNSYYFTYFNILLFCETNLLMNPKYLHGSICLQVKNLYYATLIYTKLKELFRFYILKFKKEVRSDLVKHSLI